MMKSTVVLVALFSVGLALPLALESPHGVKGRRINKKIFTEIQQPSTEPTAPRVTESDVLEIPEDVKVVVSDLCMNEGTSMGLTPPSDEGYSTIGQFNPCQNSAEDKNVGSSTEMNDQSEEKSNRGDMGTTIADSDMNTNQEEQNQNDDSYHNIQIDSEESEEATPPSLDSDEEIALSRDLLPPKIDNTWNIMKEIPEITTEKVEEKQEASSQSPRSYVKGVKGRWRNNS